MNTGTRKCWFGAEHVTELVREVTSSALTAVLGGVKEGPYLIPRGCPRTEILLLPTSEMRKWTSGRHGHYCQRETRLREVKEFSQSAQSQEAVHMGFESSASTVN